MNHTLRILQFALLVSAPVSAQAPKEYIAAEAGDPGLATPAYEVPYGPTTTAAITQVLDRIHAYLDANTPTRVINRESGAEITDFSKADPNAVVERGHFPITAYEWGVTYSGMLLAFEKTGDERFKDYIVRRLGFIADKARYFQLLADSGVAIDNEQLRKVLRPAALDDSGAMCAAMVKAQRAGFIDARPLIDNFAIFISSGQFRLEDGTLARNRPMKNSLWLDDLYMSVPALAQLGKLTGEAKYYDDSVKQINRFSDRMFNKDRGLYMHGWIADMKEHPEFYWARANGWALMAMTELLEVLPQDHPGRQAVLGQYRASVRGLQRLQASNGLWHQLLDRNDTYLETSASAIYTFCMARGINRGWIDPLAYGPCVQLAWNGVATQVNDRGQVEGTCTGTGMGFDPAFYQHRPQSPRAAHGYGPVLLAGAEMITLTKSDRCVVNDGAVQFDHPPAGGE